METSLGNGDRHPDETGDPPPTGAWKVFHLEKNQSPARRDLARAFCPQRLSTMAREPGFGVDPPQLPSSLFKTANRSCFMREKAPVL